MKNYLLTVASLLVWVSSFAQTSYKTTLASNVRHAVVVIERNNLVIEGYAGTDILIETDERISSPETAQGLQRLHVKGLTDNSGLGLSVLQSDSILSITEVCNCYSGTYRIKIPMMLHLTLLENGPWSSSKWIVRNLTGDADIRSEAASVSLDNLSGSIKVLLMQGKITANLDTPALTKPITLVSRHGIVSLTIPDNTKATVTMQAWNGYGDIFTDFDTSNFQKTDDKLTGKLNGGGNTISLQSRFGNLYLRKRKSL